MAAAAQLKMSVPLFIKALTAFPVGSKEFKAVQDVIKKLSDTFGGEEKQSLVPAAVQQLAQAAHSGAGGAPPAIAPGASSPQPGGMAPSPESEPT